MRYCALALGAALLFLGLAGCGKKPSETREYTEEEDAQIEAELRRRVEREGEGSARRARLAEDKDDEEAPRPAVKKKR